MAGSDYDISVCAASKVSDRRHLSELHIPDFCCRPRRQPPLTHSPRRLINSTPGVQGVAHNVMEGFRSFRHSKLECSCHESCVFRICSRMNIFYIYAFYHNPGHDGSCYDCLLESMARMQSVDDNAVFIFVSDANAHYSEWSLITLSCS